MSDQAMALAKSYGGYWGEHSKYLVAEWVHVVQNGGTRYGYWDWVLERLGSEGAGEVG